MPPRPAMTQETALAPEVLARLAGLKVRVERVVEGLLAGIHRSARHGVSTEFVDHKAYSPGDDPRRLDWKVLARLDRVMVRRFLDETRLAAFLAMDASGSMGYRGSALAKLEYAKVLAGALAALLLHQGDEVGLLATAARPVELVPSGRGEHLLELLGVLEALQPQGPTHLAELVERYLSRMNRRGLLLLFSDLFDADPAALNSLRLAAARGHSVRVFLVLDADEIDFPFEDPALFTCLEQERQLLTYPREVRDAYREEMRAFIEECRRALGQAGATLELSRCDEPPDRVLRRALSAWQEATR
ncbi:MAG: DUF58 domain-containing protein [Myxococcales bacterium]|nr:DUF58 domain-containing protein [Myxococcales bacterium]